LLKPESPATDTAVIPTSTAPSTLPRQGSSFDPQDWKQQLANAIRTAPQLVAGGWVAREHEADYAELLERFPMVLPPYYAGLIDRTDPLCPIRRQAIPAPEEMVHADMGKSDPLEDLKNRPAPRITHRYHGRALLHLTPNCSMVCRYCFRKSLLAEGKQDFVGGELKQALEYIANTRTLTEIIFSGGDPFLANENTLIQTLEALGKIPHLKRIRFHSRVPVTLPMRVTKEFAELLTRSGKTTAVVCHFNHPRELTPEAAVCIARMRSAGMTVFNQSVLLSGVNDSAAVLGKLCEGLFELGAVPYYLHHPDPAQGTAHFEISAERGVEIVETLQRQLPGYLVPRYVVDNPDFPYKRCVAIPESR
ncbi:KamA family radical SAM protein, partial [bacterium]|nr:KamA family radical SAM protein [bacterium]